MKQSPAVLGICAIVLAGCKDSVDDGPIILGFSSELRAEMRAAIAADDPNADADQVVADYMERVRQAAEQSDIKPNAAGDYVYPTDQQKQFDAWADPKAVMEIYNEFEPRLPSWAEPMLDEYRNGAITPERTQLLMRVVIFEVIKNLSE